MNTVLDQARDDARAKDGDARRTAEIPTAMSNVDRLLEVLEAAKTRNLAERQTIEELEFSFAVGRLDETGLWREVTELVAGSTAPELALDTISLLFKPGDVIEIRCLDPHKKQPTESYCGRLDVPAERARMIAMIREAQRSCRNVYFGINPRRAELSGTSQPGSALDVVARRTVVLDLDLKDAPDVDPDWVRTRRALRALDPVLELNSGNGFHIWFRIEDVGEANLAATARPLAAAMARLGADNMADLPRISRLPFTLNFPSEVKQKRGAGVCLAVPVTE